MEYVSGFSDLSPFQNLPKLKALHFENLRKVSSFDGLRGIKNLKYLHISGTLDWKQPLSINIDYIDQGYVSLLGKGEGRIKLNHPDAHRKLEAYFKKYEDHKQNAREIIQKR
ncbi:hypothetical protein [Chryseobacterium jejuense]|uniref:hypothetical protein n=1 Tax=Chryseobacterium jejuense TaxID=445960 RepID=UPI001AE2130D|nr:hypothetical protein [Chryseobacterium jejuense]MBP2617631.1 hypothetical protein [Chryseobacterium jejuense]